MKEKVLITVKTYPTLSRKYQELVCTAGVNENGQWRRIYPVQFRQLQEGQKYKKYQWVEADLEKSTTDNRPETFKITNPDSLRTLQGPLTTDNNWRSRREEFINQIKVYDNLKELIHLAHENKLSLALFRPAKWIKFSAQGCDPERDPQKIAALNAERRQLDLFKSEEELTESFKVVKKLPYKFRYKFDDAEDKRSNLMVEDWEIGALYWKCLHASGNKAETVAKVRQKYWDEFVQDCRKDTLLILGTTLEHHNKKAPNPFVIVGVVPLPKETQLTLL